MERPKRRRYKDNPYYLIYDEDKNKYYILFKDEQGVANNVEISLAIYDAFNRFELDDLSELNEYDNHIEHNDLYEESLYKRINRKEELVDDYVIRKSTYEDLIIAINKLPEIQRRRIKKYYYDEKNEYEIAKEENTSRQMTEKVNKPGYKNDSTARHVEQLIDLKDFIDYCDGVINKNIKDLNYY